MRFPRTLSLLSLTVFALLLTTLAHADFQTGKDAYDRGDYETAFKEWQPLADQGDARAQYRLGAIYHDGQGVPQDYA
jgi:TPR repeat protein